MRKSELKGNSKSQFLLKEGFNSSGSKSSVQSTLPVYLCNQKSVKINDLLIFKV